MCAVTITFICSFHPHHFVRNSLLTSLQMLDLACLRQPGACACIMMHQVWKARVCMLHLFDYMCILTVILAQGAEPNWLESCWSDATFAARVPRMSLLPRPGLDVAVHTGALVLATVAWLETTNHIRGLGGAERWWSNMPLHAPPLTAFRPTDRQTSRWTSISLLGVLDKAWGRLRAGRCPSHSVGTIPWTACGCEV